MDQLIKVEIGTNTNNMVIELQNFNINVFARIKGQKDGFQIITYSPQTIYIIIETSWFRNLISFGRSRANVYLACDLQ